MICFIFPLSTHQYSFFFLFHFYQPLSRFFFDVIADVLLPSSDVNAYWSWVWSPIPLLPRAVFEARGEGGGRSLRNYLVCFFLLFEHRLEEVSAGFNRKVSELRYRSWKKFFFSRKIDWIWVWVRWNFCFGLEQKALQTQLRFLMFRLDGTDMKIKLTSTHWLHSGKLLEFVIKIPSEACFMLTWFRFVEVNFVQLTCVVGTETQSHPWGSSLKLPTQPEPHVYLQSKVQLVCLSRWQFECKWWLHWFHQYHRVSNYSIWMHE